MKVLLLTVTAGQGHNQAARSLCEALGDAGIENEYLDVFEYINPVIKETLAKGYIMSTKRFAKLYGKAYGSLEDGRDKERYMSKIVSRIMAQKLIDYISDSAPDAIVCTHVFAALLISAIRHKISSGIKTLGIITDFTIHPYWENTDIDFYVTASELLNHQAEKRGIARRKLLPIGIPIQPRFAEKTGKKEARAALGLADKRTVLVMSGSMGYGKVGSVIEELDRIPLDFQIISVCGYNERLKKSIDRKKLKKDIYNIGYTDRVDLYMDSADCIITKPGGLTTSEALAKGVPMIIVNPIPGQEDRNVEFLLNNGAALKVSKTFSADEAVYQLFSNTERQKNIESVISFLGKPNSTRDFVEFVANLK